jgi:hypothetical protein
VFFVGFFLCFVSRLGRVIVFFCFLLRRRCVLGCLGLFFGLGLFSGFVGGEYVAEDLKDIRREHPRRFGSEYALLLRRSMINLGCFWSPFRVGCVFLAYSSDPFFRWRTL